MKKMLHLLPVLLAALLPSAVLAQESTIKIGSILALTGPGAEIATSASEGIRYAIDQVNAAGGLDVKGKKYKVEYISYDDQLKASEAIGAYSRLIEKDKAKYVFTMISASHLALKSKIEEDNVFVMTSAISNQAIDKDTKHAVRIQTLLKDYLPPMIKWMKANMKGDRFVRIYPNDESGRMVTALTDDIFAKVGYKGSTEYVERLAKDFAPVLTKILANPPDIIDTGPTSPATTGLIARQARELGYKGQFVLLGGSGQLALLEALGKEGAEGLVHMLFADPANPDYQKLAAAYQKKYNAAPNELIVNFYDGAVMMMKAIQLAGTPDDPIKVREVFPQIFPHKSLQGEMLTFGGKESIGTDAQVFSTNYIAVMKNGQSVVVGAAR